MKHDNTVLISLIGEQPAPNVLPLRYYQPDRVVLVHTDLTARLAERIADVVNKEYEVMRPFCKTEPFLVDRIRSVLTEYVNGHAPTADLIFNLTGGTKTMEYAALDVARRKQAKAFYYQTEGNQNLIHPYHFNIKGEMVCDPPIQAQTTLKIEEFLSLYIEKFQQAPEKEIEPQGKPFERLVLKAMDALGPEYEVLPNQLLSGISGNVEVDWILRYGSTFAVGEVKLKASKSNGIDQLNSATEQRMLGTYTKKFLISLNELHKNDIDLAASSRINVIVLPSGRQAELSKADMDTLLKEIRSVMEPKK